MCALHSDRLSFHVLSLKKSSRHYFFNSSTRSSFKKLYISVNDFNVKWHWRIYKIVILKKKNFKRPNSQRQRVCDVNFFITEINKDEPVFRRCSCLAIQWKDRRSARAKIYLSWQGRSALKLHENRFSLKGPKVTSEFSFNFYFWGL